MSQLELTTSRTFHLGIIEAKLGYCLNFHSFLVAVTVVRTKKGAGHVIVTSSEEMRSVSLYRCDKARTCSQCVGLQDPYCAWEVREARCSGAQSWAKGSHAAFLQSVPTGRHPECPGGEAMVPDNTRELGTVINQVTREPATREQSEARGGGERSGPGTSLVDSENPTIEASVVLFSLETLIITVSAGAVAALVVGFVTGNNKNLVSFSLSTSTTFFVLNSCLLISCKVAY